MPELPEVETVARGLAKRLEGRKLAKVETRRGDLRWPFPKGFAKRLTGRRVVKVRRRAKYIVAELDDGNALLAHLGMSGRMLLSKGRPALEAHDHVIIETDDGWVLRFNDARRFGMMDIVATDALERHKLIRGIGPEPLGNDFSGPVLAAALKGKKTSIKAAILDQKVVAGVGNIYASEALYRARISPKRMAYTVQGDRAEKLAAAIKAVLNEAVAAGGSSLRDYVQADGELGYFQHKWRVYEKEGRDCPHCGGKIRRIVQGGRSTFYCPSCQR
ncbi:MAG TPA: bifunctional DNA-formamidopyrimidine glycosylase/DNA-(apurinic or apyrimidinic site) lyase [Dongiaceae bacterium]|jgi:formamidopyrimidine-DNA glycosylase|nr:bifunctional DNA-formamidopyrimidine glycosylase/DNA-(apurinic or apyrimidinic site) lyase [Dongiaceae bacterium]